MIHPLFLVTYPFSAEIEVKQMGWLQFIENMTGHLAWPLVILILLIMVRKQIHSLAERILELSFGGATVKFEKLLSKGAEIIEDAPTPPALPKDTEPVPARAMLDIPSAYAVVEKQIGDAAARLNVKTRDPSTIMRMLWKRDLVTDELVKLHETLREARNAVLHGAVYAVTDTEEREYARQALFLSLSLQHAVAVLGTKKTPP